LTKATDSQSLHRVVGLGGATLLGLGSILGTGVFVSIGLAAGAAGPSVILAVVLAAGIATCWTLFFRPGEIVGREILECAPLGCQLDPETPPCTPGPRLDRADAQGEVVLDDGHTILTFGPGFPGLCARLGWTHEEQFWRFRSTD
jgi:hypothetical protein